LVKIATQLESLSTFEEFAALILRITSTLKTLHCWSDIFSDIFVMWVRARGEMHLLVWYHKLEQPTLYISQVYESCS